MNYLQAILLARRNARIGSPYTVVVREEGNLGCVSATEAASFYASCDVLYRA